MTRRWSNASCLAERAGTALAKPVAGQVDTVSANDRSALNLTNAAVFGQIVSAAFRYRDLKDKNTHQA